MQKSIKQFWSMNNVHMFSVASQAYSIFLVDMLHNKSNVNQGRCRLFTSVVVKSGQQEASTEQRLETLSTDGGFAACSEKSNLATLTCNNASLLFKLIALIASTDILYGLSQVLKGFEMYITSIQATVKDIQASFSAHLQIFTTF